MSMKKWVCSTMLALATPMAGVGKPADLPVEQRVNYADQADGIVVADGVNDVPEVGVAPAAEEAFDRAEHERLHGRVNQARRGYQEAHLLAPTSRVGRQAIQRLRELENGGNDFSEEQEPPLLRQSLRPDLQPRREKPTMREYLEMLRITVPLGMAPTRNDY